MQRDRVALDEALVADTARWMLDRAGSVEPAQVAAERRAFDVLRDAYFADPARALAGDRGGGQLSFGLPGVEELLTPVLLAASAEVLRYLGDRGAAMTRSGVRRMLGRPVDPPPAGTSPPAASLTPEQWAEVRTVVTQALVQHGRMAPHRAALIAAAVVGDGMAGPESS